MSVAIEGNGKRQPQKPEPRTIWRKGEGLESQRSSTVKRRRGKWREKTMFCLYFENTERKSTLEHLFRNS